MCSLWLGNTVDLIGSLVQYFKRFSLLLLFGNVYLLYLNLLVSLAGKVVYFTCVLALDLMTSDLLCSALVGID